MDLEHWQVVRLPRSMDKMKMKDCLRNIKNSEKMKEDLT
jgi:hypothetical protein